jgi:hypothetical protein
VPLAFEGETHKLSGKILLPLPDAETPAIEGHAIITWYDDTFCLGNQLGSSESGPQISQQGSWIPYEFEAVAPTGTQSVRVLLWMQWDGNVEPEVAYYDDQVLTLPEPNALLPGIALLSALAARRNRSERRRTRCGRGAPAYAARSATSPATGSTNGTGRMQTVS